MELVFLEKELRGTIVDGETVFVTLSIGELRKLSQLAEGSTVPAVLVSHEIQPDIDVVVTVLPEGNQEKKA